MLAYPLPLSSAGSSIAIAPLPTRFLNPFSNKISPSLLPSPPKFIVSEFRPSPSCSNSDSTPLDSKDDDFFDDDDGYYVLDEEPEPTETFSGDGVCVEIKKLGKNSRKIRSKIGIDAGLDTVWNILTDYEKLADFIPGLTVSKLVEKKGNSARLYQIGEQKLPLGLKFNAKVVLDCYEKDLEISPFGKKRDIEFKMVEGDFQCFEGKWSIEQFNGGQCEDSEGSFGQNFQTSLSYVVDVKPKLWLPVHLIEGRICREIKMNLSSIREETKKERKRKHNHSSAKSSNNWSEYRRSWKTDKAEVDKGSTWIVGPSLGLSRLTLIMQTMDVTYDLSYDDIMFEFEAN